MIVDAQSGIVPALVQKQRRLENLKKQNNNDKNALLLVVTIAVESIILKSCIVSEMLTVVAWISWIKGRFISGNFLPLFNDNAALINTKQSTNFDFIFTRVRFERHVFDSELFVSEDVIIQHVFKLLSFLERKRAFRARFFHNLNFVY